MKQKCARTRERDEDGEAGSGGGGGSGHLKQRDRNAFLVVCFYANWSFVCIVSSRFLWHLSLWLTWNRHYVSVVAVFLVFILLSLSVLFHSLILCISVVVFFVLTIFCAICCHIVIRYLSVFMLNHIVVRIIEMHQDTHYVVHTHTLTYNVQHTIWRVFHARSHKCQYNKIVNIKKKHMPFSKCTKDEQIDREEEKEKEWVCGERARECLLCEIKARKLV